MILPLYAETPRLGWRPARRPGDHSIIQPFGEGCCRLASAKPVLAITHHSDGALNVVRFSVPRKGAVIFRTRNDGHEHPASPR
jgi:hypothetical protein